MDRWHWLRPRPKSNTSGGRPHHENHHHRAGTASPEDDDGSRLVVAQPDNHVASTGFCDNSIITSKYTLLNIVPKAIWEQFRRLSNVYFLIVAIISFFKSISPVSPATTVFPLVVVVAFGMARDIYEDFARKRQDKKSNGATVTVLRHPPSQQPDQPQPNPPHFEPTQSRNLRVGDVISLHANEPVPADVLLLFSSISSGVAYCSTANLDGESSLKRRFVPPAIQDFLSSDPPNRLGPLTSSLVVQASRPNKNLENVLASFRLHDKPNVMPVDTKNVLLRGSVLRNTEEVYALVLYTGRDTKVALNMRDPPSKLGQIEVMMNKVIIALFILLILLSAVLAILAGIWQGSRGKGQWYMGDLRNKTGATTGYQEFFTFFVLFHTFIAISLFITLEFVRVIQGVFIYADVKMRSRGHSAIPKAGNLHEVLGNVEYILSDKTGTLTQNIMRFAACSAGGQLYDMRSSDRERLSHAVRENPPNSPAYQLVLAMSLTHDVVPEKVARDEDNLEVLEYHGQSPDEVALVAAARDIGITLEDNRLGEYTVQVFDRPDRRLRYKLLALLEFNSFRKRMSVVVQEKESNRIYLFTKGADSVMGSILLPGAYEEGLRSDIHSFAVDGLRTLVYAKREIDSHEYAGWSKRWSDASNVLQGRAELQGELAAELEVNLSYVGCTAVEDRLQDRVPETIQFLREAGVRIWVLTGDKLETAENIGYSTNLLSRSRTVEVIDAESEDAMCKRLEELFELYQRRTKRGHKRSISLIRRSRLPSTPYDASSKQAPRDSIIIGGSSLEIIEGNHELEKIFMDVSDFCRTVICARVTPSQKAKMVELVRRWRDSTTLAIGDGGNDVSMIQEAHVGVGIVGNEGTQAALAADYSISEFRHLQRLMTVHGRFAYIRTAGVINLSLYKNIVFTMTQFFFQFFDFASGTTIHNEWINTLFNAIFTVLGPFLFGVFERDLEESTLERFPGIYLSNRNNRLFNYKTVCEHTLAYSVWHAAVIFFGTYFLFGREHEIGFLKGRDTGFAAVGLTLSILVVAVVLFKFILSSHILNAIVLIGNLLSFLSLFALVPLFVGVLHKYQLDGVLGALFSSPRFHLLWPFVFVVAFIPDFIGIVLRSGLFFKRVGGGMVSALQRFEERERRQQRRERISRFFGRQ